MLSLRRLCAASALLTVLWTLSQSLSADEVIYSKKVGPWNSLGVRVTIDGSIVHALANPSWEYLRTVPGVGKQATLYIRCEKGRTQAFINFAGHFMADINDGGVITYRIDNEKAQSIRLKESTNNEALMFRKGNHSIRWTRQLFGKSILYVQATPYRKGPLLLRFPIHEIEDAIEPLRNACNW